ncbi:MAG: hypothetical protein GXY83_38135 [Rhodopirellula sp.]|nr:hypothetical protein [Rhodopirellula sp.]
MSEKYLLPCPCGRRLVVQPSQAGETIACPCGSQLEVPSMQAVRQLEIARTISNRGSAPGWGWRQAIMLLGALILVSALGLALYLHCVRPRLADPHVLSPGQTWAVWQELRNGPDRNLTPWDKRFIDAVADNRHWKLVWLTIAACGAVVLAIAALGKQSRPRRKIPRDPRSTLASRTQSPPEEPRGTTRQPAQTANPRAT